jgi:hypothetical protein
MGDVLKHPIWLADELTVRMADLGRYQRHTAAGQRARNFCQMNTPGCIEVIMDALS